MDPLEALRSAISKKRKLEWKDGNIFIDQHVFPGKTYTCMKKPHSHDSHKEAKETSYYTLDSIFFFWTILIPIAGIICYLIIFVVRIICFFQVASGKAKDAPIVGSLPFLK